MTCAPGEESDQPGNPPIQIRALTTCALWVAKVAQADLSLRESFWDFGVTGPFIGLLKNRVPCSHKPQAINSAKMLLSENENARIRR